MTRKEEYPYQSWADTECPRERMVVSDAIANGECPESALDEYRYWRTPSGRNEETEANQ